MALKHYEDKKSEAPVVILVSLWLVVAWLSADFYFSHYAGKMYREESELAEQQLQHVAANIDEGLQQLKGIPIMVARDQDTIKALRYSGPLSGSSNLAYEERKKLWSADKLYAELSDSLKIAADNLVADVIWVLNSKGDCIVSSNMNAADSFVGMNYADREYFRQAKAGHGGRQYAVGRASAVPGLFFSAPVFDKGEFIGAVVAKRNISSFSLWTNQADAFLSDANGVIILAPEKDLEFRALPSARAMHLPLEKIQAQYKQSALQSIDIAPWGDERFPGAVKIANFRMPILMTSKPMLEDAINIHVRRPLGGLVRLSNERLWFFILLAILGSLLIYAASEGLFYLRKLKRTEAALRVSATAFESQESMMITDANGVILQVNRAFTENTGYTSEEAVGKTSALIKSSRHNDAFSNEMWETVRRDGAWHGEIWTRRKDGAEHPDWLTLTAVKGANGDITHYVGTQTDISLRKAAEREIEQLAFYDPLTALPNRRLLMDRLKQALGSSARSGREGALLFIDLDNFKSLNDTLGHDKGDLLLKQVAQRLAGCVREIDTVARLGGDEFVIMLEELSSDSNEAMIQTGAVAKKVLASLNQDYVLDGHAHHSSPSIGITLFEGHNQSIEDLLKRADLAMYEAKMAGRNGARFFDPAMQTAVAERVTLENDLRQAVAERQFTLYYQPQVDLATGNMTGAEALIRWQHPRRGTVAPNEFIPLAEETGLILPIGTWVLETACHQLAVWAAQPEMAHLSLAINVSAGQFRRPDFVSQVLSAVDKAGADPRKLKLELTESMMLENVEDIIAKMTALKAHGIGCSLDDFGTGYSSLSYLKRLPLDQLKIDRSFVQELANGSSDAAICSATIDLARNLRFKVVAEGVETDAQRNYLKEIGCDFLQGYLVSKPLPQSAFEAFYRKEWAPGRLAVKRPNNEPECRALADYGFWPAGPAGEPA